MATLPVNCWSSAGDLLLDLSCDVESVLACLVGGARRLPWPLLWLDTIEAEEPRWKAFQVACRRAGLPVHYRPQFDVGLIDIGDDWSDYQSRWSRNHRRDMARRLRKAEKQGPLTLEIHEDVPPEEVEPLLTAAFEVEDRSWKGPAGTSVLRTPRMLAFYLEQARQLAEWRQLRIATLNLNGWPIAFEYGYQAEGVYFSHKVGYDEAYRDLAPGQLLMMLMLERQHADPHLQLYNCMGMLTGAVAKWCTRVRPIGRIVVGTGGAAGNALMRGYGKLWPLVRRVRQTVQRSQDAAPSFAPGCAPTETPEPVEEPAAR